MAQAMLILLVLVSATLSQAVSPVSESEASAYYGLLQHPKQLNDSTGKLVAQPLQITMDCGSACNYRCSKASRAKLCLRYCKMCCLKCNCVPPGTSGNKQMCLCYANMMSSKGTPKCP